MKRIQFFFTILLLLPFVVNASDTVLALSKHEKFQQKQKSLKAANAALQNQVNVLQEENDIFKAKYTLLVSGTFNEIRNSPVLKKVPNEKINTYGKIYRERIIPSTIFKIKKLSLNPVLNPDLIAHEKKDFLISQLHKVPGISSTTLLETPLYISNSEFFTTLKNEFNNGNPLTTKSSFLLRGKTNPNYLSVLKAIKNSPTLKQVKDDQINTYFKDLLASGKLDTIINLEAASENTLTSSESADTTCATAANHEMQTTYNDHGFVDLQTENETILKTEDETTSPINTTQTQESSSSNYLTNHSNTSTSNGSGWLGYLFGSSN